MSKNEAKNEKPVQTVTSESDVSAPVPVRDEAAALAAAQTFAAAYAKLPPEFRQQLKTMWLAAYNVAGHRRLARIVLER